MIYEYKCSKCNYIEDITKPSSEYNKPEYCNVCKNELTRLISVPQLMNIAVEDSYYSIPLGKVVTGKKDERNEAKNMGLVEVGNEDQNKHISPTKDIEFTDTDKILSEVL